MSMVWICNEWDPLEEVIVGNPLRAIYLSKSIGSKWIDMNLFSINPGLVVVDRDQSALIKLIESKGVGIISLKLRRSKMLGGGFHRVALDIRRSGTMQRYFD